MDSGRELVVSTGVVITVSAGIIIVESLIGGLEMSDPVVFSGVSQLKAAIARKALNSMYFI